MSNTYSQQNRPAANLGRYRRVVAGKSPVPGNPHRGNGGAPGMDCDELIRLAEKVAGLEEWRMSSTTDLKAVLDVIQQAKVLMALSLGGGILSILSLVLTLVSLLERNF